MIHIAVKICSVVGVKSFEENIFPPEIGSVKENLATGDEGGERDTYLYFQ